MSRKFSINRNVWSLSFLHFSYFCLHTLRSIAFFGYQVIISHVVISSLKGSFGWEGRGYVNNNSSLSYSLGSSSTSGGSLDRVAPTGNSTTSPRNARNKGSSDSAGGGPRVAHQEETQGSDNDESNVVEVQIETTAEGDTLDLHLIPNYDWSLHKAKDYATRYQWPNDLGHFTEQLQIFKDDVENDALCLRICIVSWSGRVEARLLFCLCMLLHRSAYLASIRGLSDRGSRTIK